MTNPANRKRISVRLLALTLVMFVFAASFGNMNVAAADKYDILVTYRQDMARPIVDMINEYRTSGDAWYWNPDNSTKTYCGYLPALKYDYDLEKVAMQRAAEIAVIYGHTRPDGSGCFAAYSELGYSYSWAGENIAAGYRSNDGIHEAWMEEKEDYSGQGHRRNILSGNFQAVGIACVYSEGYYYWVEEFSGSCVNQTETVISTDPCTASVKLDSAYITFKGISIDDYYENVYSIYEDGPARSYFSERNWYKEYDWSEYIGMEVGQTIDNPVNGILFRYTPFSTPWSANAVMAGNMTFDVADSRIAVAEGDKITARHCGVTELTVSFNGERITYPIVVTHKYKAEITPATKDSDGKIISKCECCGKEQNTLVIPRIKSVSLDGTVRTYNGKYQKPKVTVLDRQGGNVSRADYDVKYSNYKKVGTATVTVTFSGDYEGGEKLTFTINPKPVKIASVSTTDGVVVKWKKLASQCDGYEIEYANNKSFTQNEGIAKVAGRKKTSRKLLFSKRNGTRYVRIRSYKVVKGKTYYSEWSDAFAYEY